MNMKLYLRFVDHGSAGAWHEAKGKSPKVQAIEAHIARALELMGPDAIIVWRTMEDARTDQCTNEYQLR